MQASLNKKYGGDDMEAWLTGLVACGIVTAFWLAYVAWPTWWS